MWAFLVYATLQSHYNIYMIIIGDVHGCLFSLQELLRKVKHFSEPICFVGDLIDRGPHSKQVVDIAMKHDCVKGNHEDLLVHEQEDIFPGSCSRYHIVHMKNGGYETYTSFGGKISDEYMKYFQQMPAYKFYNNIKVDGKPLLVSHSFAGSCSLHDDHSLMWNRWFYINEEIYPNSDVPFFNVFGHTPVDNVLIRNCYAMIDTGCVFKKKLSAVRIVDGMSHKDIEVYDVLQCD